jgi:predicted O-linked N-acetylglucosamine transferase (SPINDLY family)
MREKEIDIAIDLMGLTRDSRPNLLAARPAPVQVSYLGYPATQATTSLDYILADKIVIPDEHREHYTEHVVYLPDSYQINDSKRKFAKHSPTRQQVGLPATGLVFCSFNNHYKITSVVFDVWMRLLHRVEGSVLWLIAGSLTAARNLRQRADEHGISRNRLIFAPRTNLEDHLARHRLADIFLDTGPCNAHTTASDALWAGVPVITCVGTTFAGRVAASLLHAIGLPELVTDCLIEYEALALKLAQQPELLAALKAKLARNRTSQALFDTERQCRYIESAYATMWERHQRGQPPIHFAVARN